jgi:hypothetical protein
MQSVQTSHSQSAVDRIFAKAELKQLGTRYDPVLAFRKCTDLPIPAVSLQFPVYQAGNYRFRRTGRGHGPTLAGSGTRVVR